MKKRAIAVLGVVCLCACAGAVSAHAVVIPPGIFNTLHTDFRGSGIWNWGGYFWGQLSDTVPENMVSGASCRFSDANFICGAVLYADFGAGGIWNWNGSVWRQLTSADPENMMLSYYGTL